MTLSISRLYSANYRIINEMEQLVEKNWQENPKYSEKSFPLAPLLTTNSTCNLGCHDGRPSANHLSYGMVLCTADHFYQ
jgi:hypothetical protein